MRTLGTSLPPQIGSSTASGSSDDQHQQTRALYASERARLLFGQYRKGDANDPDTYVASVALVLSDYPTETIRFVTDPRTGVATKYPRFMPNPGEVKQACEEHYGPTRRVSEWDAAARKQIAQREQLAITDGRPRKTYDQIQAEFAEVGIHIGRDRNRKAVVDCEAERERLGISKEQWDAIPNAPSNGKG